MESARRVGLPPAYEDADIDALCQLIGTCDLIPRNTNYHKSLHDNSAHARPPDIHQRPYSAFTVRVHTRPSERVHTRPSERAHTPRSDYFCFSLHFFRMAFLSYFCDFSWRTAHIRVYFHDLMMPGSPHPGRAYHVSTLRPYRRSPYSIISGASYALPISRCAFLRSFPLHRSLPHPTKRTWLTSTFPPLRHNGHRRPAYSSSYTTSTRSVHASQHSLYPP
jgi:hypothetical protein